MPSPLEFEINLSQGGENGYSVELRTLDPSLALTPARGAASLGNQVVPDQNWQFRSRMTIP